MTSSLVDPPCQPNLPHHEQPECAARSSSTSCRATEGPMPNVVPCDTQASVGSGLLSSQGGFVYVSLSSEDEMDEGPLLDAQNTNSGDAGMAYQPKRPEGDASNKVADGMELLPDTSLSATRQTVAAEGRTSFSEAVAVYMPTELPEDASCNIADVNDGLQNTSPWATDQAIAEGTSLPSIELSNEPLETKSLSSAHTKHSLESVFTRLEEENRLFFFDMLLVRLRELRPSAAASDLRTLRYLVIRKLKSESSAGTLCSELNFVLGADTSGFVEWLTSTLQALDVASPVDAQPSLCGVGSSTASSPLGIGARIALDKVDRQIDAHRVEPSRPAAKLVPRSARANTSAPTSNLRPDNPRREAARNESSSRSASGRQRSRSHPRNLETLSRKLGRLLRHQVRHKRLKLSIDGFASVEDVVRALHRRWGVADIRNVVQSCLRDDGEPRFQLQEDPCRKGNLFIRAARSTHENDSTDSQRLSKALSSILRHTGVASGISFSKNGFAPYGQVLAVLRKHYADPSDVEVVVRTSYHKDGVPRFEFREHDGQLRIRATRHHTMAGIRLSPAPEVRAR